MSFSCAFAALISGCLHSPALVKAVALGLELLLNLLVFLVGLIDVSAIVLYQRLPICLSVILVLLSCTLFLIFLKTHLAK